VQTHRKTLFIEDQLLRERVGYQRTRHIGDFQGWMERDKYKKALGRLLKDLKAV